jgi:hypothetical protein
MSKVVKVLIVVLVVLFCRVQLPVGGPTASTLAVKSEYQNSLKGWLAGVYFAAQSWTVTDLGVIKLAEDRQGRILVAEPFTGRWWLL